MPNPPCLGEEEQRDTPLIEFTSRTSTGEQMLVTVWWDGTGTVAFRWRDTETWSAPTPMERISDG